MAPARKAESITRQDIKDAIETSQELVVEKLGRVGDAVENLANAGREAEQRFAREIARLDAVDKAASARSDLIEAKAETAALKAMAVTGKLRTFSAVSAGIGTIIGAVVAWFAHVIGVIK